MLYKYLPYFVFKALFGDRRKFGLKPEFDDSDFIRWRNKQYLEFYSNTQKRGIGKIVNSLGYSIMRYVDLGGKIVLELGPGIMEHLRYSKTRPEKYILVDVKKEFLETTSEILKSYGVYNIKSILVEDNRIDLPLDDESVDVIIAFYQLEHI